MELWQAVILGLVEGITEYLPVSSTGHLIIAASLLGLDREPVVKEAVDAFSVMIQGGGILAVLGLYRQRVMQMLRGLLGREKIGRRLFLNLLVAFIPAAVIGVIADQTLDLNTLLFHPIPVLAVLAVGGVVMLLLGPWQRRFYHGPEEGSTKPAHEFVDLDHLTWRRALVIGLFQCLALWPGTSRSMTTIVGGMVGGLRPREAAEFSFLLGLPTLGGACVYRGLEDVLGEGPMMTEVLGVAPIVAGSLVAAVSAAVAIRWLVTYLTRHGVAVFGWYRIALCAVIGVLSALGVVTIAP